jgi:S1-C subfamily serine protease
LGYKDREGKNFVFELTPSAQDWTSVKWEVTLQDGKKLNFSQNRNSISVPLSQFPNNGKQELTVTAIIAVKDNGEGRISEKFKVDSEIVIIPKTPPMPKTDSQSATDPGERVSELGARSVVAIYTINSNGDPTGIGSGFVVQSGNGVLVATNYHVVESAIKNNRLGLAVRIIETDFKKTYKGSVIKTDKLNDLALVRVPELNAPALALGKTGDVDRGSKVFLLGSPEGKEGVLRAGTVPEKIKDDEEFPFRGGKVMRGLIPLDLVTKPGNSGGPVFNRDALVVGIVVGGVEAQVKVKANERKVAVENGFGTAIQIKHLHNLLRGVR